MLGPDYVVNAGGVLNIAQELAPGGYDRDRAWARITGIRDSLAKVFALANGLAVTPALATDRLAEQALAAARSSWGVLCLMMEW